MKACGFLSPETLKAFAKRQLFKKNSTFICCFVSTHYVYGFKQRNTAALLMSQPCRCVDKTDTCSMSNNHIQTFSSHPHPSFLFFQFQSPHFQLQIACRAPSVLLIFSLHLMAAVLPYLALQQSLTAFISVCQRG